MNKLRKTGRSVAAAAAASLAFAAPAVANQPRSNSGGGAIVGENSHSHHDSDIIDRMGKGAISGLGLVQRDKGAPKGTGTFVRNIELARHRKATVSVDLLANQVRFIGIYEKESGPAYIANEEQTLGFEMQRDADGTWSTERTLSVPDEPGGELTIGENNQRMVIQSGRKPKFNPSFATLILHDQTGEIQQTINDIAAHKPTNISPLQ